MTTVDIIEPPGRTAGSAATSLQFDVGAGPGETVVVVAPTTMPRDERLARAGQSLRTHVCAVGARRPLPSFRHLHDFARALSPRGIGVVATLPLYATFLDDPYDPSPYSPVSRLHWSEVYLDDDAAPGGSGRLELGDVVDWRAARRAATTPAGRGGRDADPTRLDEISDASSTRHPDVGAYARFRASRDAGGDLVVERSYVLAQYLADEQLGRSDADPDAAALALDLPIGSHPLWLRGVGRPDDVRRAG